jgi:hypothetical protein
VEPLTLATIALFLLRSGKKKGATIDHTMDTAAEIDQILAGLHTGGIAAANQLRDALKQQGLALGISFGGTGHPPDQDGRTGTVYMYPTPGGPLLDPSLQGQRVIQTLFGSAWDDLDRAIFLAFKQSPADESQFPIIETLAGHIADAYNQLAQMEHLSQVQANLITALPHMFQGLYLTPTHLPALDWGPGAPTQAAADVLLYTPPTLNLALVDGVNLSVGGAPQAIPSGHKNRALYCLRAAQAIQAGLTYQVYTPTRGGINGPSTFGDPIAAGLAIQGGYVLPSEFGIQVDNPVALALNGWKPGSVPGTPALDLGALTSLYFNTINARPVSVTAAAQMQTALQAYSHAAIQMAGDLYAKFYLWPGLTQKPVVSGPTGVMGGVQSQAALLQAWTTEYNARVREGLVPDLYSITAATQAEADQKVHDMITAWQAAIQQGFTDAIGQWFPEASARAATTQTGV